MRNSTSTHDAERMLHVERMARFIGEKSHESIAVADVARAAGLQTNYAMAVFNRAVGLSINQSITRHRLDAARSLLVSSDLPIMRVAFDVGFGSLSRFYEAFEDRFHVSPGAFRRSLTSARLTSARLA